MTTQQEVKPEACRAGTLGTSYAQHAENQEVLGAGTQLPSSRPPFLGLHGMAELLSVWCDGTCLATSAQGPLLPARAAWGLHRSGDGLHGMRPGLEPHIPRKGRSLPVPWRQSTGLGSVVMSSSAAASGSSLRIGAQLTTNGRGTRLGW